ncbi:EVE domain-containing protein [Leucobacter viscericola]|uniref:EVE domain-containing protein n=1 Tax=Leucobacter viscericola TaxID=2714935 RepID=A0A6G7XGJ0_9MICO|nr:EVE domain-containing protein [Leucobacter viscericola]QIK63559.1 EVE domain-containing protein [Leucobacter viscericola]
MAQNGWLGVVSAAHVRRAHSLGIVQVNHGKRAPLARMNPGDPFIYYSSVEELGDTTPLRMFTAFAKIEDGEIWQSDEGCFKPFRRRAEYLETRAVPLAEVKPLLHLTSGPNWGYQLRRGLVPLDAHDIAILREAMGA